MSLPMTAATRTNRCPSGDSPSSPDMITSRSSVERQGSLRAAVSSSAKNALPCERSHTESTRAGAGSPPMIPVTRSTTSALEGREDE